MAYRYQCATCGDWHEGFPHLGFDRPLFAANIPQDEFGRRVKLSTDLCEIDDEWFFIRCLLLVPISGIDESFGFGVWSSLSRANLERYRQHYHENLSSWAPMFGYLSNALPDYPDTAGLKLEVQTQSTGLRPLLTLEPTDHPVSVEQREGMSLDRAKRLVDLMLHA